jgi:hypothetical protein
LMLTAIWGVNGFRLLDLIPLQHRFNAQYFVGYVMMPVVQTVFLRERARDTL